MLKQTLLIIAVISIAFCNTVF